MINLLSFKEIIKYAIFLNKLTAQYLNRIGSNIKPNVAKEQSSTKKMSQQLPDRSNKRRT